MAIEQQYIPKNSCGLVPNVESIISTVNLDCKLNLQEIVLRARNAEFNPKRFPAVIMRMKDPKTTALIFASSKLVCTGAKSRTEQDFKIVARIIQKLGFPAKFKDFRIVNIVASCAVKFPIKLERFYCSPRGRFSTYEPELFPGLVYLMKESKIVILIFVSGKIVIAGVKNGEDTYSAFNTIFPVLAQFKK